VSGPQLTEDGVKWLRSLKLEYLSLAAPAATDKIVEPLVEMKQLTHLALGAGRLTDEGLKRLSAMRQLKILWLGGTAITNEGLAHLRPMRLTALSFWPRTPQISDAGLKHLQELKTLRSLNLVGTSVTDAGIPELARMTWLTHIYLNETKVTAVGLRQLQKALPSCTIEPAPPAADPDRAAAEWVLGLSGSVIVGSAVAAVIPSSILYFFGQRSKGIF